MPNVEMFEKHAARYDAWFNKNRCVYETELQAIRMMLPKNKNGVEVGVGSGRFAAPLGIKLGIEPSKKMREIAQKRGIEVIDAVAEDLPFKNSVFDFVLMVTIICFVDDIEASFREAYRVLKPHGSLIIGFVDKNSIVGRQYLERKETSVFYGSAHFYTVPEVVHHLKKAGFRVAKTLQTLFHELEDVKTVEPVREGYGEGSFVVIKAVK